MQATLYHIRRLRNATALFGWLPCLAMAASLPSEVTFESIPRLAYVVTFSSAILGGLAGTLHRMSQHMMPGAPGIKHPKIFVSANMLGGLCAGWLSFLIGTHAGTPTLLVQGIVLVSGFGGAAVVERFVDKFFPVPKTG